MFTRLRKKRQDRGLSLRAVAQATGIPKSTLHRIEGGQQIADREHARILYRYYGGEIPLALIYDPLFEEELHA